MENKVIAPNGGEMGLQDWRGHTPKREVQVEKKKRQKTKCINHPSKELRAALLGNMVGATLGKFKARRTWV